MLTKKWKRITSAMVSMAMVIALVPAFLVNVAAAAVPFTFTDDFSYAQPVS